MVLYIEQKKHKLWISSCLSFFFSVVCSSCVSSQRWKSNICCLGPQYSCQSMVKIYEPVDPKERLASKFPYNITPESFIKVARIKEIEYQLPKLLIVRVRIVMVKRSFVSLWFITSQRKMQLDENRNCVVIIMTFLSLIS